MAESLQQTLRRQLLSAAAAGSAAFEISGVLELSKPLDVFFKGPQQPAWLRNDPTDLQPLLNACSSAMFGLGRQTLHDEAVRKALQLPADRLGLGQATTLPSGDILDDIGELMKPEAAGPIRAEAYALNVYSPDGFFKAHRDTPTSTDMFGSLIFCLPTGFTGGELIVRSPDLTTSVTHDWGSTSRDRLAGADNSSSSSSSIGGSVAWAAMYSDCEHEIKPVTTGHRITITYNIYQSSVPPPAKGAGSQDSGEAASSAAAAAAATAAAAAAAESGASIAGESAFGAQLAGALTDATWFPAGVTLGLVLEHFYAVETLKECMEGTRFGSGFYGHGHYVSPDDLDNRPESIEPAHLKGSDLQLYRAARAFGLQVKIVPVVSLAHHGDSYDLRYAATEKASSPMSPGKLAIMRGFQDDPTGGEEFRSNAWGDATSSEEEEDSATVAESEEDAAEACAADGSSDPAGEFEWQPKPWREHRTPEARWAAFIKKQVAESCAAEISGDLLRIKPPGKQHLKYCGPAQEYEGNSGTTTCFYAAAALLVVVPPSDAPERQG